jgi:hypothetical protein
MRRFSTLEHSASASTAAAIPYEYTIHNSIELSRLIFTRMNSKSFLSFIEVLKETIEVEERVLQNKSLDSVVSRHDIINKIARKDKWVTSWLLRVINTSHYESHPFPMLTSLPVNDEIAIHKSCLADALLRAKSFVEKGKLASPSSNQAADATLQQDYIHQLSSMLVDSMPLTSSEELIVLIERFSCEEISEIELRAGFMDVIGLHVEFIQDFASFLEINISKSMKLRIQTSALRKNKLVETFAEQIDELVEVGIRARDKSKELSSTENESAQSESSRKAEIMQQDSDVTRRVGVNYCFRLNLVCRRVCRTVLSRESTRRRSEAVDESEAYDDTSEPQVGAVSPLSPTVNVDDAVDGSVSVIRSYNKTRRKVFVGNLPHEMTVDNLIDSLRSIGKVVEDAVWIFRFNNEEDVSMAHPIKQVSSSGEAEFKQSQAPAKELSIVDEVSRELADDEGYHDPDVEDVARAEVSAQPFLLQDAKRPLKPARNPLATFAEIEVLSSRHLKRKKMAQVAIVLYFVFLEINLLIRIGQIQRRPCIRGDGGRCRFPNCDARRSPRVWLMYQGEST